MPQLLSPSHNWRIHVHDGIKILCVTTKTWCNQINILIKKKKTYLKSCHTHTPVFFYFHYGDGMKKIERNNAIVISNCFILEDQVLRNMKMGKSKLSHPPHSESEWKQMPCFVDLSTGVVWMGSDVGQWQAMKQPSEELKYMVDVQ